VEVGGPLLPNTLNGRDKTADASDTGREPSLSSLEEKATLDCPYDSMSFAVKMAMCAFWLGCAIHANDGFVSAYGLYFLTISLAFCIAAIVFPSDREARISPSGLALFLLIAIAVQACLLLVRNHDNRLLNAAIVAILFLGLLQFFDPRRSKAALIVATAILFLCATILVIRSGTSRVDVYAWQQRASAALKHGLNPYEVRILNPYPTANFYGPGVVDKAGYLTYGFPYPPLNLLITFPSFLLLDDVRYAEALAIAVSMALMSLARPEGGWIGPLAAVMFLLTPRVFFVVWASWTEPLLLLTFSLTMFSACRWRRGLPWALGLFLATKQYAILALPLLPLLASGPDRWKQVRSIVIKAGLLATAINLPFFLWNIREFTRAVVLYQFVQPFRFDALSYPALLYSLMGRQLPMWVAFLILVLAIAIALWRCPRSPAGFAGAVTFVSLLFFAFAKQAFCNYYYFVIGTACWSVAAARMSAASKPEVSRELEVEKVS
jgi:hypothetical protein